MNTRLGIIGLVVADMEASLAFYRMLGAEFGAPAPDGHIEAVWPGGLRLALDTEEIIQSFHPGWQFPRGGSRISLGYECDGPAGVDAVYERLVAAGYHGELEPFDAAWGDRWATVHDPDGNGIDLYAPLNNKSAE
jgi:uncharacterized glyoxalase superfamily protein PhnB